MSTRRKRPSTWKSKQPVGPDGRPACYWCKGPLPGRKRSFCSDRCVHEHKLRSDPGYLRRALFLRDKGYCADCGEDTAKIELEVAGMTEAERRARLQGLGYPTHRKSFWDAHHVTAVKDGGGECGLDGYITLCCRCHKEYTARQRKGWAKK